MASAPTDRILRIEAQYADGAGPEATGSLAGELRGALVQLARRIAAAGAAPHHLAQMSWHVVEPADLARERRAIDLVYRDIFGGTRPPIAIRPVARLDLPQRRIGVSAELAIPLAAPAGADYRGLDLAGLAREYSARAAVPDHLDIFARWRAAGAAFRRREGARLDLPYGIAEGERFDLFHPAAAAASPPLVVLIHGGYWQAMDKDDHGQLVADLVAGGAAAAVVNYTLAPEASLATIVAQLRACLAHLVGAAEHYGYDPTRITLIGHSAGAHLAAMLLAEGGDEALAEGIAGAVLVSGLFDLEPLSLLPMARALGIADPAEARRLSPALRQPVGGARLIIAVGGAESAEFKRQSALLAEAWGRHLAVTLRTIAGAHHFAAIEDLLGGELGLAAQALVGEGTMTTRAKAGEDR